jgi:hypothetical protein
MHAITPGPRARRAMGIVRGAVLTRAPKNLTMGGATTEAEPPLVIG